MTDLLISAATLAEALDSPLSTLRVIDCRSKLQVPDWGNAQYLSGHIPRALFADLDRDLAAAVIANKTGRHPLPEPAALAGVFSRLGIGPLTRVIAYDDAGGVYASRLWWLLRWLGHDNCALLDGGLPAWAAAGYPLEPGVVNATPQAFIGQLRANMTVTAEELLAPDSSRVLFDVRGPARFSGKEEPIDPIAGHIPGAINLPFSGNLDRNNCFLPATQLHSRYADVGSNAVSYCGSGVTACHGVFAMMLAGLSPAKIYPGSWSEWIVDPTRPIATR